MKHDLKSVLFFLILNVLFANTHAEDTNKQNQRVNSSVKKQTLKAELMIENLNHPWSFAFIDEHQVLITERPGNLKYTNLKTTEISEVDGLPNIIARGQGGLLDIALDPEFHSVADEGYQRIFLSYVSGEHNKMGTTLASARLQDNQLIQVTQLWRQKILTDNRRHFGSRLVIDDDYIYMTIGDRGDRPRAQDAFDSAGSVIRLFHDGSIPPDNPFMQNKAGDPAIYSYGHRNPQGMAKHPVTREIWLHEHGPQGGDEINIVKPGANYGWPVITYGANYGSGSKIGEGTHHPDMTQPIHHWTPSIAPSGMVFYTGNQYPDWQHVLFVGSLKFQSLVSIQLDGERIISEERLFPRELGRIRDIRQSPDGFLYLITDASNGGLFKFLKRIN